MSDSPKQPQRLERLQATLGSAALTPLRPANEAGAERRVGVEVEFGDLPLDKAADIVADVLGGRVDPRTQYEVGVETEQFGRFELEIDNRHLKELGQREREQGELGPLDAPTAAVLEAATSWLTPLELVTPPVPIDFLPQLDEVLDALARRGARGTQEGLLRAFGVHYNPEISSASPDDLLAHLQAYALLGEWLRASLGVDLSRRVTTFVDPFPSAFVEQLVETDTVADLPALVALYLESNPTRNRALDALPLFLHLAPDVVRAALDDPLLKARPTWHFRLTDSRVGRPGWSVTEGWRHWLVVEDVACDRPRLLALRHAYRLLDPALRDGEHWLEIVREHLA